MEQPVPKVELFNLFESKPYPAATNTLGTTLLNQLYSTHADQAVRDQDRLNAIDTILEIASEVSLEKQKEFIAAYCRECKPAIDTSTLNQVYATYIKDENCLKAEQAAFNNRRAGLYETLEQLKGWYTEGPTIVDPIVKTIFH